MKNAFDIDACVPGLNHYGTREAILNQTLQSTYNS